MGVGSPPLCYNSEAMISYDDFEKVDIRVGKIVEVQDFPEARAPAFKNTAGIGWVLITPAKASVEIGSKLQ